MAKLGKHQLQMLFGLASPAMYLVVGDDRLAQSLVKRGLLRPKNRAKPDRFLHITPDGMRALAAAYDTGLLKPFMKWKRRKKRGTQ